jgi:hypothetical protein
MLHRFVFNHHHRHIHWSGLTKTTPRPGPDHGLGLLAVRSPQHPKTGPVRLVWSSVFAKSPKTGPDRTTGFLLVHHIRIRQLIQVGQEASDGVGRKYPRDVMELKIEGAHGTAIDFRHICRIVRLFITAFAASVATKVTLSGSTVVQRTAIDANNAVYSRHFVRFPAIMIVLNQCEYEIAGYELKGGRIFAVYVATYHEATYHDDAMY